MISSPLLAKYRGEIGVWEATVGEATLVPSTKSKTNTSMCGRFRLKGMSDLAEGGTHKGFLSQLGPALQSRIRTVGFGDPLGMRCWRLV